MTASLPSPRFALQRERLDLRFRSTTLASRRWITPQYVRVRVEGDDLVGFGTPGHDDHVRIFIPAGRPATAEELRASPSREFTPLQWGEDWLDLEFAVHGDGADGGVAGAWAATAPLGSVLGIGGPRGSLRVQGRPDAWFLAGDETAIPQIRRYAALIPAGTPARVLVEVRDAEHEVPVEAPVRVEHLHRGSADVGTALAGVLDGLGAGDRPAGDVFAFIASEQSLVRTGRALVVDRWGLDPERVVVKGYWKRDG